MPVAQTPRPGTRYRRFRGDTLTFTLTCGSACTGSAFLRTNIGWAEVRRQEVVALVEEQTPVLDRDWHDVPMRPIGDSQWELTLGLCEVGRFEAKPYLLPGPGQAPVWDQGDNVVIKVEPAETVCANSVYSAFVRQFGPNQTAGAVSAEQSKAAQGLDKAGFTVIPRSGTFRDLIAELDHIIGTLGFSTLHLLPVHPVPTTYARMGRFGSPFAPLDFMDVDPAHAEFDRKTTPLEQYIELIDAIHARGGRLLMDIPANHTGWASHMQNEHPEWFARHRDSSFRSPGAWGVTWEDLSELDYGAGQPLWEAMAEVFLRWCRFGVDGFRCDAGYMVPYEAWCYIIAKVRAQFPDTIFLLEGLGGPRWLTEHLLDGANMNWAYSELFQSCSARQIEAEVMGGVRMADTRGLMMHYAETHDNTRMAAASPAYSRMRTALTALTSTEGAFGITAGVEWFATERVDVHGATSLNWGADVSQVDEIGRLNALLASHPAFGAGAEFQWIIQPGGHTVAVRRSGHAGARVMVLANLDCDHPQDVRWACADFAAGEGAVDLLTGHPVAPAEEADQFRVTLEPAAVLCLGIESVHEEDLPEPPAVRRQRARAAVLELQAVVTGCGDVGDLDVDAEADRYLADPAAYWRALSPRGAFALTTWQWPQDLSRDVMWPDGHALLVRCPHPVRIDLEEGGAVTCRARSFKADDGHVVLLPPRIAPDDAVAIRRAVLHLCVHDPAGTQRGDDTLLLLSGQSAAPEVMLQGAEAAARSTYALCTNGRGAMAQVRAAWGEIESQYDALLAANLHPDFPVDRQVMLTRCRVWVVYQGYHQALGQTCLRTFGQEPEGDVQWRFDVPVGRGKVITLDVALRMLRGENAVQLAFTRVADGMDGEALPPGESVRLVVRPDVEDRINHGKTKAFSGPEAHWSQAVEPMREGFLFRPDPSRALRVTVTAGTFHWEPEWTYMVQHPHEADRGLDAESDLFSPGYLACELAEGGETVLNAAIEVPQSSRFAPADLAEPNDSDTTSLLAVLRRAMDAFVVRRDDSMTVIAGYPWFLDWGRDTLICLRGMIAAGMHAECRDILRQFARFETQGTLPNMIRGDDDSNRDTSDAPLWFVVSCQDLLDAGDAALLDMDCDGRSLRDVIRSIVTHYREGTANGIVMDADSGLVFSPSHYTWMDTNHPAGTPREGYPIEIQALWYRALAFLAQVDADDEIASLAAKVQASIGTLYVRSGGAGLSDCLHGAPGTSAAEAVADDHVRSNQLLAVTLAAVTDADICTAVLTACEELLVPGAIRSLADRPVTHELPVWRDGELLNNPQHPYQGQYRGDEDRRRKPAYHNGTAWTWPFPSYCEALVQVHGPAASDTALALLHSSEVLLNRGCIGQIPEILDGDAPHADRGCGAQAWGVTELYRVLALLQGNA
ncbi:MAG: amylo-alpha-1,6-glucosidase [Kiritimatiellia bacterium]|nr:amylo-alpha-1,6-glucosidase [Kiritimatiellia bacterium]MDP6630184.1 amylo-alpha-1,6-glucosidase [Kiritimatiellia bacterium]MDP6810728.1 amylo-alpha-1,6-glucosidase [Kiritimatiellia bacterium]MDP7023285.1 amylo-alpha-1,6-glucosidase [Kiritimatiellia bacterium]